MTMKAALSGEEKSNPTQKRMRFATKDALVLTFDNGQFGVENNHQQPRFVFYVDDDAEKLEFVEWFIKSVQSEQFSSTAPFDAHVIRTLDAKCVLFFESHDCDGEKDERVFPISSDTDSRRRSPPRCQDAS